MSLGDQDVHLFQESSPANLFLESIGYLCIQIRCHNMESDMPPPARGTPSKRAGGHRNIMTPDLSVERAVIIS